MASLQATGERSRQQRNRSGLQVLYLVAVCFLAACQSSPRRLPYIPPTLSNWPQPYRGIPGLQAHLFVTGHLEIPEALLVQGGSLTRRRQLAVQVLAVQHPREGVVLIDCGLDEKTPASQIWPLALPLVEAPPVRSTPATPLPDQLRKAGIRPQAVRWIVQSNLRAIRIGQLAAFEQARVVAARAEYDFAMQRRAGYSLEALRAVKHWQWVDFSDSKPLATFPTTHDLFGDGSIILVEARGPTPGTLVVIVRLPDQALLWAGDTVPTSSVLRTAAEPRALWNGDSWWWRYWQIKRFADLAEEVTVVPAFDSPMLRRPSGTFRLHEVPTPEAAPRQQPTTSPWERFLPRPW